MTGATPSDPAEAYNCTLLKLPSSPGPQAGANGADPSRREASSVSSASEDDWSGKPEGSTDGFRDMVLHQSRPIIPPQEDDCLIVNWMIAQCHPPGGRITCHVIGQVVLPSERDASAPGSFVEYASTELGDLGNSGRLVRTITGARVQLRGPELYPETTDVYSLHRLRALRRWDLPGNTLWFRAREWKGGQGHAVPTDLN